MAIMKRCCCCGIRQGSIASGIYSMVITGISIMLGAYHLIRLPEYKDALYAYKYEVENELENMGMAFSDVEVFGDMDIDGFVTGLRAEYWYSFLCNGLVFVTSAILIKGIKMDRKEWLLPFIGARLFYLTLYTFALILSSYTLSKMGMQVAGIGVAVMLVCLIPGVIIDILCILCVFSQYQEYRDGRGRPEDQVAFAQNDAQTAGTKGFSYHHMAEEGGKDAPPPYDAP